MTGASPTAREKGFDIVYTQFWGAAALANLEPAVAAGWADKLRKATETNAWQDKLTTDLQLGEFKALGEAGAYFAEEQATFRTLLTAVGLAQN